MSDASGRISEGMSYGEVVTMFPSTRTIFAEKGVVYGIEGGKNGNG